ncbi:lipoate--protein ligase family protein [Geminocystis sp. GBBB08]|uniref:lipoate--protein ligase family protein n=1 Tax=Geminocystis sp. GBBB08 TaxID=2604140 RepID=UPI0027E34386|nr:lipoate--protein ligase family protein [Geminocystis sp. GBBB08]MBL1210976.1 lipoate--protein ligase family protein [Geminocystis sp. GBBB08]
MQIWRFIPLIEVDGKLQMAIDEWLLSQHQNHNHPPTLRFYTWNPVAISLGVSQKRHFPSHWQHLTYQGKLLDLVKRPSGGRGVLHQGDLTYAVITSHLKGNLDQVYRQICQFLILGWQRLGVNLDFGQPEKQYLRSPNCFKLATNADLVDIQGNKFIGSSQLKKGKFTLQHGSMLLKPDIKLFESVFNTLPPRVIIPNILSLDDIIKTLTEAATECFNCQFVIQPLSKEELQEILNNEE